MVVQPEATSAPPATRVTDRFDLIELNHFDAEDGGFDQVIFWNWMPDYRRFRVEAWVMLDRNTPSHTSAIRKNGPRYVFERLETGGLLRRVEAKLFRETWTTYDPERLDKELFPENLRTGLSHIGAFR